jgi:hypothetical protein
VALAFACAAYVASAIGFWMLVARHHFQADLTGLWGAGRLQGQRADPLYDPLFVGGELFPRTAFYYGPLVSTLFRPLGALDYATARRVWFGLQAAAFASLLALGPFPVERALLAGSLLLLFSRYAASPLFAHFERGQVDLLVALGAFASLLLWERGAAAPAGALLLATTVLKLPAGLLFLAPLAARDVEFLAGGGLAALAAAACALLFEGPARIARYFRVVLPGADRSGGDLIPQLQGFRTPGWPTHRWQGRDYRCAEFAMGAVSLTPVLRRRLGHAGGTALALAGIAITFVAAAHALAPAPLDPSRKALAWLAALTAMLAFQPLTWVMGCVHLVPVALRLSPVLQAGGLPAVAAALLALLLVCLGESVAAPKFRRRLPHRATLGVLLLWSELLVLLAIA